MIDWKQRLYAFLIRRVLGPLLDASSAQKLHESIDVSLEDGRFILKNIDLDAAYLTEQLSYSLPGIAVRCGRVDNLEINLTLRENSNANDESTKTQSSFAWRAMKLGSLYESFPAVSLIADSKIDGVFLELEAIDLKLRRPYQDSSSSDQIEGLEKNTHEEQSSSKSILTSYINAALATLQLTLKLTNIHIKFCHRTKSNSHEAWVGVKVSSFSYSDLDAMASKNANVPLKTVDIKKVIEFTKLTVETGEDFTYQDSTPAHSVVALAEGSGQIFLRIFNGDNSDTEQSGTNEKQISLQRDIEMRLNHQLNFSFDNRSLWIVQQLSLDFSNMTEANTESDDVSIICQSSILNNPHLEYSDREDLIALNGIMRQYREAYHLAEQNKLRGGILVPTNAYLDEAACVEEVDEEATFDIFFDANEQSMYNVASILLESAHLPRDKQQDDDCHLDKVHTKLRISLLGSSFKINFPTSDEKGRHFDSNEYILVTLSDINLSLLSTQRTSEVVLGVTHIQVEDAYFSKTYEATERSNLVDVGTIKIGSLLGWSEGDGCEESDALVSEAPCLSMQWKCTRKKKNEYHTNCNATLLAFEVSYRQQTVENISKFINLAKDGLSQIERLVPSPKSYVSNEGAGDRTQIYLSLDCPSISIYLPLTHQKPISPMFERCGETFTSRITRESCIAVIFEDTRFLFESEQCPKIDQSEALSGKFLCQHMGLFAVSPEGESWCGTNLIRKDIFVASGCMQVNPCTPISFGFIRSSPTLEEGNKGRESFPILPAISSFKARQEDDDGSIKSESPIFPKFSENTSPSRKDLRRADPQIEMLANSEKSNIIFSIKVPEIIFDLTTKELELFTHMLGRIKKETSPNEEKILRRPNSEATVSDRLSTSMDFDKVTITIRDNLKTFGTKKVRTHNHSFLFAMDQIKFHIFFAGSEMMHFRFFSQDFCLYSQKNTPQIPIDCEEKSVKGNFNKIKDCLRKFSEVLVVPILFRSQLFRPISQETPSILFDFVDTSLPKKNSLQQRRVYLTIYHLTFRYDADSDWIERFSAMSSALNDAKHEDSKTNFESKKQAEKIIKPSMTRLFVTFADVNVDYKSPSYFETASKSILRIGDFRISSNMMKPAGLIQSYNLSVGDLMHHITNDIVKSQYENENKYLCRSSLVMKYKKNVVGRKFPFATMPEAILRDLNFIDILSIDAIDAIVTCRTEDDISKYNCSKDPSIAILLTVGTLTIHGCKDSFTCFINSVGELQPKLIGLSDIDIDKLKEDSSHRMLESQSVESKYKGTDRLENNGQHMMQDINIPLKVRDDSSIPLLDGHEWTTIDKDHLPGLSIPPGDEQIAGWYSTSSNCSGEILPQSQIRQLHFPLHSPSDLLTEGTMLAKTFVGETGHLVLKSRLSIKKLNVKIRFFDGYDWPDKCSNVQKKAVKRLGKSFVIEPLPGSQTQVGKRENVVEDTSSLKAKTRLMEELLDSDSNDFEAFFEEVPLPEDKASVIHHEEYLRLSMRRSDVFCQVSLNGISLTTDSYLQSKVHRLQSVLKVKISNLFVAETLSDCKPIKMIGEWSNDYEHPRDTRFGTLMLSMTTWAPLNRITEKNEIANEECDLTAQMMPMRCLLDQRAISFMKAFFNNEDMDITKTQNGKEKWSSNLHLPPPPTFKVFKVKALKVKVDYYPSQINVAALREGSVVELVNLSPIQRMVITLDAVVVMNSDSAGLAFSEIVSSWIKQICATQLHKFLTNARPFEPFTDVGQGLTDLVVLPYEAFKQGDSMQRAMKKGMKSLAETVVFQTLATTSGLTKIAADLMADSLGLKGRNNTSDPLPTRPLSIPKGIADARHHAARSLARGLSAANYKIVIVPYREYLRNGMSGAVTSVIRGIPVLLVAPLTGATEAASYTLLGARYALRPEMRREDEASIL